MKTMLLSSPQAPLAKIARRRQVVFAVGCLLLGACGGKGAVDLGGNIVNSGWSDTKGSVAAAPTASTTAPTSATPAVPQTLYEGDFLRAIAVDETTIAAAFGNVEGDVRIDLCQLADCQRTLQTIRTIGTTASSNGRSSGGQIDTILISHGEVIWAETTPAGVAGIMACGTEGCPEGPRRIAATAGYRLTADAEYVYWLGTDSSAVDAVLRCPRTGCETPAALSLGQASLDFSDRQQPMGVAVSESAGMLYVWVGGVVAQTPVDFSSGLTKFYENSLSLGGLVVVDDNIYFTVDALTGQLRRCTAADCEDNSELVAPALRWPCGLVADAKGAYWIHNVSSNVVVYGSSGTVFSDRDGAIAGVAFTQGAEPVELADTAGTTSGGCMLAMNSRFLFWCDSTNLAYSNRLRMVSR